MNAPDEVTHTLPWDLFTQESALDALAAARRALEHTQALIDTISEWRRQPPNDAGKPLTAD